jgi:hypothetical protein
MKLSKCVERYEPQSRSRAEVELNDIKGLMQSRPAKQTEEEKNCRTVC